MGILTDYFAASPEQALTTGDSGPGDELAPLRSKFLEPYVLVGELWEAMRHGALDASTEDLATAEERVDGNDDEGPYLFRLKSDFVAELAALPGDRIPPVAEVWATAEEWTGEIEPDEVADLVRELREVARRAMRGGLDVYCWMSL